MMPAIIFDVIASLSSAAAMIFSAIGNKRIKHRDIKIVLAGLLIFTFLYTFCLLIQWSGISQRFDKIEDFIGALLPMWWGFIFYVYFQQASTLDLKKSEENLRITIKSIGDGMIATDSNGYITRMNPVAERLIGLSYSEARGRPIGDVFHIVNTKTREKTENPVAKVLESGDIVGLANHTLLISQDGAEFQIADSAAPIRDDSGRVLGVVLVFRDMTHEYTQAEELRHLRNYLANIINSMPSALIGLDKEGKVTQWNHEAVRKTNISPENAVGHPLAQVLPRLAHEMKKVYEAMTAREVRTDSRRMHMENGEVRYEDVTIFPLLANGAEGAVIRIDDVTDRVHFEEMLIQSEKMLSVGGLAAGMAHEINNPLAGMMQTADVLSDRLTNLELPANRRAAEEAGISMEAIRTFMENRGIPRMLKNVRQSGSRASEIVQNMLSFARKSQGEFSTYNLANLLDQTVELARTDYDLKKKYDFRSIRIIREYEDDLPEISCESGKIQQVLLNILRNGAEAMQSEKVYPKEDRPCFTFRLLHEKNTDMIRMEISDNGPGMNEATRKRIFEPFFTTKPAGQGTGLGLSVSYFIITENHGGEMRVESIPNKGTTFIIRLPLRRKK